MTDVLEEVGKRFGKKVVRSVLYFVVGALGITLGARELFEAGVWFATKETIDNLKED